MIRITMLELMNILDPMPHVDFDLNWKNHTGYLDGAATASIPSVCSFIDDYGRLGVIIPFENNENIVIFQRYKGNDEVIVYNFPRRKSCDYLFQPGVLLDTHVDIIRAVIKKKPIANQFIESLLDEWFRRGWNTHGSTPEEFRVNLVRDITRLGIKIID